jgi:hypothetical protein
MISLRAVQYRTCNRSDESVGLTPTDVQRNETESQARLISRSHRERQPTDVCETLSHCAYTKCGKGLGAHKTKFAMTYLSLSQPSDRSLRRSGGGNPPHHFGSPALTGSGAVRPPRANAPRIYFHFTNKYLYAGSNDVEFIGKALW